MKRRRNQWHWHQGGPSWMVSREQPSSRRAVAPDYTFRTEREAAHKAQQLADETGERWWTWEADLATEQRLNRNPRKRRAPATVNYIINPLPRGEGYELRWREGPGRTHVIGVFDTWKEAEAARSKDWADRKQRGNPKGSTRFDKCVRAVSRSSSAVDPRAVCGAMRARGTLKRGNRGRRNDVPAAQDRYERFHGHPSKELVEVVTPIHVHTALSGMGELRKLVIRQKGARVVIKNFKGAILCQNEKATQLFIEGGDQAVNLADFGIRQPFHEKEVLGECTDVYYFTTKDHLAPQDGGTATYHHKFGRKKPTIVYDVPNALLEFAGGGYTIPDEGIDQ